jgi:hypothetical protein
MIDKAQIQAYSFEIMTFFIGASTVFLDFLDAHASGIGAMTSIVAVTVMVLKYRRDR